MYDRTDTVCFDDAPDEEYYAGDWCNSGFDRKKMTTV